MRQSTHGATACIDACRYFGGLIAGAVKGVSRKDLLSPRYRPDGETWQKDDLIEANLCIRQIAESGTHLSRLLSEHKSHIFSLIQKFNQDVDSSEGYILPDDIIVITDEAHRTQYGTLALNMRNALPNAGYIGFTGTPLFKDDEITRRVFGEDVSTYDFQRAVEDKATVPLYYDARGDKLGVSVEDLNERIAQKLEEIETQDIDVQQRLEQELKRDYHIITADKRLDQVARDFVAHYAASWETGMAMLVCIDKITCVRMVKLMVKYWDKRLFELEAELTSATDEQDRL